MATSRQLALGPMALQTAAKPVATDGKTVAPLVDLLVQAFLRCGLNGQQAAAALGMAPSQFTKAFSMNWPEQNPAMKRFEQLDYRIRREFAVLLASAYGLEAQDSEPTRVLRDLGRLLKEIV